MIDGLADPGRVEVVGGQERHGHRLVEAESDHHLADLAPIELAVGQRPGPHRRAASFAAMLAVAVVAGDLFDDVDLGGGVGPEARHGDVLLGATVVARRGDVEADRPQQAGIWVR